MCPSGGVCGIVFNDANHNGIKDDDESGLENVHVFVYDNSTTPPTPFWDGFTDENGAYSVFVPGGTPVTISAQFPTGQETSPPTSGRRVR